MCAYSNDLCAPTVADDMILISFSKYGLDSMLKICYDYACKWRFEYNTGKCAVIVFNEPCKTERQWFLGENSIQEVSEYTHLGIICDRYMSSGRVIQEAATKLRGTLLSVLNNGLHPACMNPLTLRTIYNSVVIPKSLYGAELWNSFSVSDLSRLEIAHRFCVKYIQNLNMHTSTDFALVTLNMTSIETIIDYKKLQFLGQLCNLPCKFLAKSVFTHRLVRFLNMHKQHAGSVPDIYRLLQKYNLANVLKTYAETGTFPSKSSWKLMLKKVTSGLQKNYNPLNPASRNTGTSLLSFI